MSLEAQVSRPNSLWVVRDLKDLAQSNVWATMCWIQGLSWAPKFEAGEAWSTRLCLTYTIPRELCRKSYNWWTNTGECAYKRSSWRSSQNRPVPATIWVASSSELYSGTEELSLKQALIHSRVYRPPRRQDNGIPELWTFRIWRVRNLALHVTNSCKTAIVDKRWVTLPMSVIPHAQFQGIWRETINLSKETARGSGSDVVAKSQRRDGSSK